MSRDYEAGAVSGRRVSGTAQQRFAEQRTTDRLRYLSHYDAMTTLPNRAFFRNNLRRALKVAAKNDQSLAVFFLSLDPYARINHTLGPAMGDRLVRCVARRVKGVRPANAAVGYWGSDRFVLLLEDFADEAQIVEFAKDIKKRIERSFFSYKQEFFLTSSIGIARYPLHGATVETLLKNAGAALFEAQECGGNCYRIYSDDLDARSLKSFALENWLGRGLQRQQFSLQYQPQVNTDTGEIKGAEALIRWEHPELGPIQPADFIPFAEKSGLIIPIGEWVLRAACLQLKQWHADGFSGLTLAINVSARQLQEPAAVDLLVELLKESELDPEYLELELTESSLMTNAETVIKSLGKLRDIGVKLAIDDFGTGFSSLEYLRRLPLDILKIDQSFIRDTANHKGAALVTSIVALAHWLRLQVVAEGVETPEQAAFLQRLGCVVMQGYLFSRPLLSEQFKRLLSAPNHQFKESNQFAQAQAAS